MPLVYLKLADVTILVTTEVMTRAALLASMTALETRVVNLKGRILTAAQMESHLDGTIDGETVAR